MEESLVFHRHEEVTWLDPQAVPHWSDWDSASEREALIHRIHAYPAKFPAHIAIKSFDTAKKRGIQVSTVTDIFCGCGTVAFESLRHGYSFSGSDINPVAALIARVKSTSYDPNAIAAVGTQVLKMATETNDEPQLTHQAALRLKRWYSEPNFRGLAQIQNAIHSATQEGDPYRDLLNCAFSAILKSTSQWKPRSTKPSISAMRVPISPLTAFERQIKQFTAAWSEQSQVASPTTRTTVDVRVANATDDAISGEQKVDLLITSPPYVTSYDYASIHQLSLLWLGFTSDHRTLRTEMIGNSTDADSLSGKIRHLNRSATHTVFSLYGIDPHAASVIARYYSDMQKVATHSFSLLRKNGMAVFVIGNTEHKGIKLDNAAHLCESLLNAGFRKISLGRRSIQNKMNTPHRTSDGRFNNKAQSLDVYSQEYIIVAEK